MDLFHDGLHVRLRSRDVGTYLYANSDGEGVSLRDRRASLKAAWVVHLYHDDDNTPYVLLHSAAYGRYLAATDAAAPSGCFGFRVAQRNYDQPHQEAIRWQAVRAGSGDDIMLRHVGADFYRYLRANGRYLRWNNAATVDRWNNVTTMMQWVVEPIPARESMPRLPRRVRFQARLLGLPVEPSQLIQFVQANDAGIYNEQGWTEFLFTGRSVYYLWNELRIRVGDFNFIMCVRAGRYGRLTPLAVNLPRVGSTIEIVVIRDGTQASDELRHPAVDAW